MKKRKFRGLLSLLLALILCLPAGAVTREGEEDPVPEFDGYLVALRPDRPQLLAEELEQEMDCVVPDLYATHDYSLAMELMEAGLAEYVEPNYFVTLMEEPLAPPPVAPLPNAWVEEMLGMDDLRGAFPDLDGRGLQVAVVDSGVDRENPNLQGASIEAGWDYTALAQNPKAEATPGVLVDQLGHGTKVCQCIAGSGANGAVRGTAPSATIVPIRCFAGSNASMDVIVRALYELPKKIPDCDIVNMSWGLNFPNAQESPQFQSMERQIESLAGAGILMVAAGGNKQSNAPDFLCYPAAFPQVLGVGNLTRERMVSNRSVQSEAIFVSAPGTDLPFCKRGSEALSYDSGTSFAAPFVTGLGALMCELVPGLSQEAMAAAFSQRAEDLGETGWDAGTGHGLARGDLLFGSPWQYWDDSGGFGWLESGKQPSHLILAGYSDLGQLQWVREAKTTPVGQLVGFAAPAAPVANTLKHFFLNEEFAPLGAAG